MEKTALPPQIKGTRIVLKSHTLKVAPRIFRNVDKDRKRLRVFLPWVDKMRTLQDEITYIQMTQEAWAKRTFFDFGIYRLSDSKHMGNCGVHNIAWEHNRCELGYWILEKFEGKGYVREAVSILESTLFGLGMNRIEIRCSSRNVRSASIPKRLGYCQEGALAQEMMENGKYRDTLIFAKLKSEYRRMNSDARTQKAKMKR